MRPDSPPPDVTASVVTYNSVECLDGLLESIRRQKGVTWELLIVDNHSTDGTPEALRRIPDARVTLNARNAGFGTAHNQNIQAARGRHMLLLNPDLTFGPDLFAGLTAVLDSDPRAGIVAPRVFGGVGPDRREFIPRRFYPGEFMVPLDPSFSRDSLAWISGCCVAMRRETLEQIGNFDEAFFLYGEDPDICRRTRQAGWEIVWYRDVTVEHAARQSQKSLSHYEQDCNRHRGTVQFLAKHYPPKAARSMIRFQALMSNVLLAGVWIARRAPKRKTHALYQDHLRARRDMSLEWLRKQGARPFPVDAYTWRIVGRQIRVLMEWARQGRYPLDEL